MSRKALAEELRVLLDAEIARITAPCGTLFLILGRRRSTKDDNRTTWLRNGERWDFEYLEERVVASGRTAEELRASAREYKRLRGMSVVEYLAELAGERVAARREAGTL